MPAARPARSEDLPRVGDTTVAVRRSSLTGSDPYWSAMARFWAEVWVKLPEISTWPSKDDHVVCEGWVIGADWTTPSSSMPMISWKYFWVMASQPAEPASVSVMLTTH